MSALNESSHQRVGPSHPRGSAQPPQYLYLGMIYQYPTFIDLHQLIYQSRIMNSRSKEFLPTSMSKGDSHEYVSKRKTLDAPATRFLEAHHRICRDALDNGFQIEGDVSQKRQKLVELCRCSQCGHCLAREGKNESSAGLDLRHIYLPNMKAIIEHASPQYSDSDVSKTESRRSRSRSSESSSRTTISSRTTSLERDNQLGGVSLQVQELPIEHQIQHMFHHEIPVVQTRELQSVIVHESFDGVQPPLGGTCLLSTNREPAPITLGQKYSKSPSINLSQDLDKNNELDRSSMTSHNMSDTPSRTSQDAPSSIMDLDRPSTEGDKSSDSKSVSETSDASEKRTTPSRRTGLERLIKDEVLRSYPPEVAEYLYQAVKGKLECASIDDLPQRDGNSDFSLLELLELQALRPGVPSSQGFTSASYSLSSASEEGKTKSSPAITTCNPSSASSTSVITPFAAGKAGGEGSTSALGNFGHENTSFGRSDKASDPQNNSQKSNAKSSSNSKPQQQLRCPFNAMNPAVFCANPDTKQKYRPCAGPGWSNIQHMKGHLKSHHTKEEPVPNALQCSRCQNEFSSQEELRAHDENVDCPITCPVCKEVFETKEMRQQHRKHAHQDDLKEAVYMEIGQAAWKTMNDNLKLYTSSLKKGKGKGSIEPKLEQWVEANRSRFESGRSAEDKASARRELGQWYIIFTTLNRHNFTVPDHPFYDHVIAHGDVAEERILLISDAIMEARIQCGILPPLDISSIEDQSERTARYYKAYYRTLIQEAVQVAAKTKLSDHVDDSPYPQYQSPVPLVPSRHHTGDLHQVDHSLQNAMSSSGQQLAFEHNTLPGIPPPASNYNQDVQNHDKSMSLPMGGMQSLASMGAELWMGLDLDFDSNFPAHFQSSASGSGPSFNGGPSYQGGWPRHS